MIICHMTSAHDSDDIRILKKQCVSLAKNKDNKVFLVAKGASYEYKNVQIAGIGVQQGGRLNRMVNVGRAVYEKALSLDADIYQFHDPELLPYAKKLKKRGKKVIFDSHENYKKQIMQKGYIPKPLRGLIKAAYSVIESQACKYLDAVLYPEDISPYEGIAKECVVIRNTPMLDELKPETPYEERQEKVCCVGTLSEDRGIRVLMRACHKAGVQLVLGGRFSPPAFEDSLRSEKAFEIVDYRGKCDRKQVNDIYNECMIGADNILRVGQYPQIRTLSTKVYEYMIMKMPYITSDFDFNREIIDKYHCGIYVAPENIDAIAEAIRFLVGNKEEGRQMGKNGRKLVEEKLNWSIDEKRLIDLYDRLYREKSEKQ